MTTVQLNEAILSHSNSLKAYAVSLTKNHNDANDLFQDTSFKAFKNRDKFKIGTNLKAWLFTIMRNEFINKYRQKNRRKVLVDHSDNLYLLDSNSSSQLNEGVSNVLMDELNSIIEELRDEYKVPFKMSYLGYKYEEIADELDIPIGTVKSRIFFARKSLKKKLELRYNARHIQDFLRA